MGLWEVPLLLAVVVGSLVVHEYSHAAVALRLGDRTALRAGRVSWDPRVHLHPWGSVVLPAVALATGVGVVGFARPVPVKPGRLRRPKDHVLLVALAGPAANVGLAVASGLVLAMLDAPIVQGGRLVLWSSPSPVVASVLVVGQVNVVLAVLNLLPVPPLDGAAMVERLLPARWRRWWPGPVWAGPVVLMLLVLPVPGVARRIFAGALGLWARLWW